MRTIAKIRLMIHALLGMAEDAWCNIWSDKFLHYHQGLITDRQIYCTCGKLFWERKCHKLNG